MQDVVQYLLENPDVVEKVINGEVSILGVNIDEAAGIIQGIINSPKTVAYYWW